MNAAAFGVFDALVIRPFSVPHMENLVYLSEVRRDSRLREPTSAANLADWKSQTKTIAELSGIRDTSRGNRRGKRSRAAPRRVRIGEPISDDRDDSSYRTRVPPGGRSLRPSPSGDAFARAVDATVRRGPSIVGRTIVLDGATHEVVGVGPQTGEFPLGVELWAPLAVDPAVAADRDLRTLNVIGRLAPGMTVAAARAEMAGVAADLARRFPANAQRGIRVGRSSRACATREWVGSRACPGVSADRSAHRLRQHHELAVVDRRGTPARGGGSLRTRRDAVANRARLLARKRAPWLFTVPMALVVAFVGLKALTASMPARVARFVPAGRPSTSTADWCSSRSPGRGGSGDLRPRPALHGSRPNMTALREAAPGTTAGTRRQRFRRALIVAQVALVLPLMVAAALSWRGTTRFLNGHKVTIRACADRSSRAA